MKVVAGGLFFIGLVVVFVSLLGCAGAYFESRCFIIFVSIIHAVHKDTNNAIKACCEHFLFSVYSVSVLLDRHHTGSAFHHLCAINTKRQGKSLLKLLLLQ